MSFDHENPVACGAFSADLSEFALGSLTGRERSLMLEHLSSCASCRGELESLAVVADALLELAPEVEPPFGFEQRLVEEYRAYVPHQRRRRSVRVVSIAAAAVILLALGFVIGDAAMTHHPTTANTHTSPPQSALLTSGGRILGHVFVSEAHPAWIYMTLDDGTWSGTAWCSVTTKSGDVKELGSFSIMNGYGAWDASINVAANQVTTAQVTDAAGHVLATAHLSA